jgi:endonuclease YncB( thermonuclease family)
MEGEVKSARPPEIGMGRASPGRTSPWRCPEFTTAGAATAVGRGRSRSPHCFGLHSPARVPRWQRVRLYGIDAPESRQTCRRGGQTERYGQFAGWHLADLVERSTIDCRGDDYDQYGRLLAICYRGDVDLNGAMVSDGQAVAYTRYSWRYLPQEVKARAAGRGLWATDFETPESWRRGH